MLRSIQTFFNTHLARPGERAPEAAADAVRRAAAAVLLELPQTDQAPPGIEQGTVLALVRDCFGMTYSQAEALIGCAEAERKAGADASQFTALINDHYTPEDKASLVMALWEVAHAEARLGRHEDYLAQQLGDLLGVPAEVFAEAKLAAERGAASGDD